jgi:hypothetical protein
MEDRRQDSDDDLPPPIEMGQQEASYSSSYNETFVGQVASNRRNAVEKDDREHEGDGDQADR